jgi:hypothetical protein
LIEIKRTKTAPDLASADRCKIQTAPINEKVRRTWKLGGVTSALRQTDASMTRFALDSARLRLGDNYYATNFITRVFWRDEQLLRLNS